MANRLDGKVALVTGGSSGIGLAIARRFAAEGAKVYITGRKQEALDAAATLIGFNAEAIRADTSIVGELDAAYAKIRDKSGRLDVVCANAGVAAFVPLAAITEDHYHSMVDTNLKGVVFTVRQALPLLSDGASVILISSGAGYKGIEAFSVYGATKAAIRQLARSWLLDLKAKKIRVNVISPGMVDTPAIDGLVGHGNAAGVKSHVASLNPLGRIAHPDDVAAAAVFLASEEAAFINGVDLPVDGGIGQT